MEEGGGRGAGREEGQTAKEKEGTERRKNSRAQDPCESRGGRPALPVPNKPTVSVDVKQHFSFNRKNQDLIVVNLM